MIFHENVGLYKCLLSKAEAQTKLFPSPSNFNCNFRAERNTRDFYYAYSVGFSLLFSFSRIPTGGILSMLWDFACL